MGKFLLWMKRPFKQVVFYRLAPFFKEKYTKFGLLKYIFCIRTLFISQFFLLP
jgi:hypothetical protein